jgi:hypothetical protein
VCTPPPPPPPGSDAGNSSADAGRDASATLDASVAEGSPDSRADGGASSEECRGQCQAFSSGSGKAPAAFACSERCTIGEVFACGVPQIGPTNPAPAPAICMASPSELLERGVGDLGLCVQLCSCNANCSHPDFVCIEFEDKSFKTITRQEGYCALRLGMDGGLRTGIASCPADAGSDALRDSSVDSRPD